MLSFLLFVIFNIQAAQALVSFEIESVTIPTSLVAELRYENKLPDNLYGKLYHPLDGRVKHAVVIILPSSAGIRSDCEIYYAIELSQNGISALVLDSLRSRGVSSLTTDQFKITTSDYEMDALIANKFLSQHRRIEASKIGVMGVSKGGTTAHFLAMDIRRKWRNSQSYKFAAYASLSPACFQYHRNNSTDGNPIFFMLPEKDDASPPKDCMVIIKNLAAAGNRQVKYKIYAGANHAWETLGSPHFEKDNTMMNRCYYTNTDEGRLVPSNLEVPMTPSEWQAFALKTCMYRGVTTGGGTPELKRRATDDLLEFFFQSGFVQRNQSNLIRESTRRKSFSPVGNRAPASECSDFKCLRHESEIPMQNNL